MKVDGLRKSLKNSCLQAYKSQINIIVYNLINIMLKINLIYIKITSIALNRFNGVYVNISRVKSIASFGVLALNTEFQGWARIWGNLNSK